MPLSDLNNINYWSVICHLNLWSKNKQTNNPPPPQKTVLADHVYVGFYKISLRQIWLDLLWHARIVWGRVFVKWQTAYGWSYGVEPPLSVFCFLPKTDFSGRQLSNLWYSMFNNRFCSYWPIPQFYPQFHGCRNHRALSLSKVAKHNILPTHGLLPLIRAKCVQVESSRFKTAPVK